MIKKTLTKILNISYILCILAASLYIEPIKADSKTLGDLKKELADFKSDYESNRLQKQMDEEEIRNIEAQVVTINQEIKDISDEIVEINAKIDELEIEIENKEQEIKDIIRLTQVSNGESAYMEFIFGAKDFTEFIYRAAISEQLSTYNNNLVEEYKNDIEESNRQKKLLSDKKTELNDRQRDLKIELDKIQVSITKLDELSLSIEEQIRAKEAEIKVYVDKGCKDDETIGHCGNDLIPPDTSFSRPLKTGYLTDWYGTRGCTDPRMSCWHNGTDMSANGANTGDIPVYPVANGVVVYISLPEKNSNGRYYNTCGGKRLYIQHNVNGKIYTSGYQHLRKINVDVGETVTKETVIGIVGGYPYEGYEYYDTCSTGSHLHLEMSTGTFANGTFYSNRFGADDVINFPNGLYWTWYDRTSRY